MNAEAALRCVDGGIDSIEHGILLDDNALMEMKNHNVYYIPTLFTYNVDSELLEHDPRFKREDIWVVERLRNEEIPRHKQN